MIVSLDESQIFIALRSFLLYVLPTGVEVVQAQQNRVPQPVGSNFVLMTPSRRERLETNIDSYADVLFTASIAGNVMTVSQISFGTIQLGSTLFGLALANGTTTVLTQTSGLAGGTGTYTIDLVQTSPSQTLAAGLQELLQPTEVTFQLDVFGPSSGDNSQIISTLFRDDAAVQQFATSGFDVTPLYTSDPRQVVFSDDQAQYEDRWIIEACLQANISISIPAQFASLLALNLVEVL